MQKKENKRTIKSINTKKMIFDKAKRLFKEKGYYNVSIEEITNATGLSVGAFYHHFKSKDELLLIWADEIDLNYTEHYAEIKQCLDYKNPIDKIKEMIFYSIEIFGLWGHEFSVVSYSYMMRVPKASARMLDANRSFFKIMYELIEDGKENGYIRLDISTKQMIKDILIVGRGAIIDWCINGGREDIRLRSNTFINTYIDGISLVK